MSQAEVPAQNRSAAPAGRIRQVCRDYLARVSSDDPGSAADLYAADAVLEDPVGSAPIRGRDRIRAFYRDNAGGVTLALAGPLVVCGREAALRLAAEARRAGRVHRLDVIDVLRFDDACRITSLRAYCTPPFAAA